MSTVHAEGAYQALMEKKDLLIESEDYQKLRQILFGCMESNDLVKSSIENFEQKMFQICTRIFVEDTCSDTYYDLTDTDPREKILCMMEEEGLIV